MLGAAGAHRKTKCAAAFYNGVRCWDELAHHVRGEARAALRHNAGAYRFPIMRIRHPDDLAKAVCNAVSCNLKDLGRFVPIDCNDAAGNTVGEVGLRFAGGTWQACLMQSTSCTIRLAIDCSGWLCSLPPINRDSYR